MDRKSAKILLICYFLLAFFSAFILLLPSFHRAPLNFLDSLFTTSSAVSLTGLIVKNTADDFSFLGQILLLIIIQIGALGYMSITSLVYIIFRRKIDFSRRSILKQDLNLPTMQGTISFLKRMFALVFILESIGAMLLFFRFMLDFSAPKAIWLGIFHSISAFCNAGFSILPNGLLDYRDDFFINLIISTLIIIGGLGYFVLLEIYYRSKKRTLLLSPHTKLVLITTAFLLIISFLSVFMFEFHNEKSIGNLNIYQKILSSYFSAVNYRTSGFNTLDLSTFNDVSLFFGSIFMVIGGAPGGTAGGIKVSVFAILLIYTYRSIQGEYPHIFNRKIDFSTINQSFMIIITASILICAALMLLSLFEDGAKRGFLALLFEVCSAFGTVGLSMGDGGVLSLSAHFSPIGKIIIIILMLAGKVGILAFALSLIWQKESRISHPSAKILI